MFSLLCVLFSKKMRSLHGSHVFTSWFDSVVDNKFVRDSVKFSNQSTTFGQAFNDFIGSRKGYPWKPYFLLSKSFV